MACFDYKPILKAFSEYIDHNPRIDVCNTKFGLTLLDYNPTTGAYNSAPVIARSPEDLLQWLREEIVLDVLYRTNRGHDLDSADQDELDMIQEIFNRYMN